MPPPFRADQVGSLLRPPALSSARTALKADPSNPALQTSTHELQKTAIADIVQAQRSRHIQPLTTGEFEREIFYSGFFERLGGFTFDAAIPLASPMWRRHFPTHQRLREQGVRSRPAPVCVGKVVYGRSPYLEDWLYLRSLVPREEWGTCKMTLPSVTFMHMNFADGCAYTAASGYTSDRAFLMDLAAAFRAEVRALYDAGCRVMQVDDPNLSYFCDEGFRAECERDGYGLDGLLEMYMEVHNECLRDVPEDLQIGLHICRGNAPNSTWYASGGYERISETVFKGMGYKLFYLEFDDVERSGGFAPLRHLPVEKAVVLGLVTTKDSVMEDLEVLKRRVMEAANMIAEGQGKGRPMETVLEENLAVSPQCGFSSASYGHGKGMTDEVMWRKLGLVGNLAQEIWPES